MERRAFEVRAAVSDAGVVRGVGVPYRSPISYGGMVEQFLPAAFKAQLGTPDDVVALGHHWQDIVLGRRSSGTLVLEESDDGLHYELTLPDTSDGRDLRELIRRGDIKGASAGFIATDQRVNHEKRTRDIVAAKLIELSLVALPAYGATTAALLRSAGFDAGRARVRRLRLLELDL
jgi:HK97 family phage prohead protease